MMRGRVRSPPPRRGSGYSPDNGQDRQYPPHHDREYSPPYRRLPDDRRNNRYSPPHGLRDSDSRFGHCSSSRYSEMERPRQGASDVGGLREMRDYGRDLDGDREKRLVELLHYNEDPRRRGDHFNHLKRVHIDAKLGSEYPSGSSVEGRDYCSRMDEDRDRHSLKMSNPRDGLPQRDSLYAMFQGKSEGIASYSSHNSNYFLEYGRSSDDIKGNSERNYHDGGFEGLESSRIMLEKSTYPSKDINFSTYTPQSGNKRRYQDHGDGGSYSPFKKFSGGGRHKDVESRLHGDLSREKLNGDGPQSYTRGEIPRCYSKDRATKLYTREEENPRFYSRDEKPESYSREGKPQLYSGEEKTYLPYKERECRYSLKDTLHHEIPLTQYKASSMDPFASSMNDLRRSYKDNLVVSSDEYDRSSGYLANPLPTENSKSFVEEATNYRKDKLNTNAGTRINYSYSTARSSDYTEMVSLSDKSYGKLSVDKDEYRYTDSLGPRNMDPSLSRTGSHREHLTEKRLWDDLCSPLEHVVSSYLVSKSSYGIGSDVEGLGRREMDLGYEGEIYRSHENKRSNEDYGYGRDEGLQLHDEKQSSYLRYDYLYGRDAGIQDRREYSHMPNNYNHDFDRVDQVVHGDYCDPLEGVKAEDVSMLTQPKDVSKRKRDISERLSINRNIFKKTHEFRPNKLMLGGPIHRNPWVSNEIVQSGKFEPLESEGSSVGKAQILNPEVRDIRKRLGPARSVDRIIVKDSAYKQNKRKGLKKNEDGDGNGSVQTEIGGPLEHGVVKAKTEPPEKSDEFKQLVRNAFFKFVKQLNENVVELKKFKERGKAGCLKCWVCGSDYGEFSDTESLVKHACSATSFGFRSQHLGYHKALCALMGWKAAEIHNDEWICEVLSVAEIASLKKDLILWPPLVIVHNSSIEKSNPDEQVAVSIEDLETIIKDMGFGEKSKVCRGKPANQSIMVVKFSATYSGFQEAERLHKFFAGNKHGRNEFLKIKSKGLINNDDTPKGSANNMQDVLYGFLGTSRDLNKLDSETKKRCVVRSKKEIQDLGDAP